MQEKTNPVCLQKGVARQENELPNRGNVLQQDEGCNTSSLGLYSELEGNGRRTESLKSAIGKQDKRRHSFRRL